MEIGEKKTMSTTNNLNGLDLGSTVLEAEWMITIDIPDSGVTNVLNALEKNIPLTQGPYDCCSFIRRNGQQRFRCLEGSHAGDEGTIQQTSASQIIVSIPQDEALLHDLFETVFNSHVNEEPTIRVQSVWGSRSKLIDSTDNPNRYWNRSDAETIHGTSTGEKIP